MAAALLSRLLDPELLQPDRRLEPDEISGLVDNLDELERDLRGVARRLRQVAREGVQDYFYLDFDIVYSAINWLHSIRPVGHVAPTESFWAALSVRLFGHKARWLPGSFFELVRFLQRQRDISGKLQASPVTDAFVHQFFQSASGQNAHSLFQGAVESLSQVEFSSTVYFVLSDLFRTQARARRTDLSYHYDIDIFQSTYYWLSTGPRRDALLNNRVDAVNFSICATLNKTKPNEHHSLISNTRHLHEAPPPQVPVKTTTGVIYQSSNPVISARQACLYELLVQFAGETERETERALDLCLAWSENAQKLKSELTRALRGRNLLATDAVVEKDSLVNLIWIFDGLQERIDEIRDDQSLQLRAFRRNYRQSDYAVFAKDLSEQIDKSIKGSAYESIITGKVAAEVDVAVTEIDNKGAKGLGEAYAISAPEGEMNVAGGESGLRMWWRADLPIEELIDAVGQTGRDIARKVYAEHYSLKLLSNELPDQIFAEGAWRIHRSERQVDVVSAPVDALWTHREVLMNISPSSVQLLRYTNRLFSVSYDRYMVGVLTFVAIDADLKAFAEMILGAKRNLVRAPAAERAIADCAQKAALTPTLLR